MRLRILLGVTALIALTAPSAASAAFAHVVAPGESLSSVAAVDGLTVEELAAANGLSSDAQLVTGSTLMIPPQASVPSGGSSAGAPSGSTGTTGSTGSTGSTGAADTDGDGDDAGTPVSTASSTGSTGSSSGGAYVVQPGDTLSAIAARAGMSVAELAAANGLDLNGVLRQGVVLQLSSGGSSTSSSSAATSSSGSASSQPVGADAQGYAGGPPYPTPEHVNASEVASIANANGVPPSLAEAIGWQESGFNNDLVSSAGARGVMQILPGTWDWIQRTLTAGTPLADASAADNVRGGVLLLHSLLAATGGDPALAAAGYYQGLPSVQQNGLYSDTQQYVNSVLALQQRFGGP